MNKKPEISTQPVGTPEQLAALQRQHEEAQRELQRRIAAGRPGDQAPDLDAEDEAILDEVWSQPE